LCVTPGPAVLLVVSQSISKGSWSGLAATLGILATNVVYFALSATGVTALLAGSARAFVALKWLGAAYLIWIGARMIFARPPEPVLDSDFDTAARSTRSAFLLAAVTQGANPKALIFFAAILPQFVNPAGAVLPQIILLGVTSVAIEFMILGAYVATCHAARGVVRQPRLAMTLQRLSGAFLVAAGTGLAMVA
jgi:homoserine/homoserine lactone efflux protein